VEVAAIDTEMKLLVFGGVDYAPIADFNLLQKAYQLAEDRELTTHVGNIFTSDAFYRDNAEAFNDLLIKHTVLAVEMEAAALYTLAAKFNRQALTIITVYDHIITGEQTTSEERQTSFNDMMTLALDTVTSLVEE